MTPSSNHGISRPMQRALASAGAVSLVVASLSAIPASFANEQQPAPHDNNSGCRNIAITADRYQGLPGEYQLAYSNYTRNILKWTSARLHRRRWGVDNLRRNPNPR